MKKLLVPCIYLLKGRAVSGFGQKNAFASGNVSELAMIYSDHGADSLLVFDFSKTDAEHDEAISCIKASTDVSRPCGARRSWCSVAEDISCR